MKLRKGMIVRAAIPGFIVTGRLISKSGQDWNVMELDNFGADTMNVYRFSPGQITLA
jgi:hypothetical protein